MNKVLLIAGHGKNYNGSYDSGATSTFGQEADYNRELATLVQHAIGSAVPVDVYDLKKNCYSYSKAGKTPNYSSYVLVVEFHFNAKSQKDEAGDGRFTGIGAYTYPGNGGRAVAENIVRAVVDLGFRQWQIEDSTNLYNLKQAQKAGTRYLLLETAFIDDGDDMKWYNANKTAVARTIAREIIKAAGGNASAVSSTNVSGNERYTVGRYSVNENNLNIRKGPGTKYKVIGYCPIGVYNITETVQADGYTWGRLKSRAGWIALNYTEKQ